MISLFGGRCLRACCRGFTFATCAAARPRSCLRPRSAAAAAEAWRFTRSQPSAAAASRIAPPAPTAKSHHESPPRSRLFAAPELKLLSTGGAAASALAVCAGVGLALAPGLPGSELLALAAPGEREGIGVPLPVGEADPLPVGEPDPLPLGICGAGGAAGVVCEGVGALPPVGEPDPLPLGV